MQMQHAMQERRQRPPILENRMMQAVEFALKKTVKSFHSFDNELSSAAGGPGGGVGVGVGVGGGVGVLGLHRFLTQMRLSKHCSSM